MYRKISLSHVMSVAVIAASFSLLNPTVDTVSSVDKVFGYGAGLSVDNTSVLNGYAVADNSYTNGFRFKMRVTIDSSSENRLQLKFADWAKLGGGATIPTTSNMLVNVANTTASAVAATTAYGTPLTVSTDLDPVTPGVQQDVYIWLKVPVSTAGGSYSTNYGVLSSVAP